MIEVSFLAEFMQQTLQESASLVTSAHLNSSVKLQDPDDVVLPYSDRLIVAVGVTVHRKEHGGVQVADVF